MEKTGGGSQMREALRDALTVGMGYIPLGAGMGMLMASAGFQWYWSTLVALFVYSGSVSYLAVPLMASGASFATMGTMTFFVNFRHVFYGLSFPLHLIKHWAARAYGVQALTDEAYAVISTRPREELTGKRVFWTQLFCHLWWITGCTTGAIAGQIFPLDPKILSFTLTALFVILAIDAFRATPSLNTVVTSTICALVAMIIAKDQMLLIGLSTFALTMIIRAIIITRKAEARP